MTSSLQTAAAVLIDDLKAIFGERLRAVVAYGPRLDGNTEAPLACLALVSSLSRSDLEGCAGCSSRWHRAHLATPLILPEREFRNSLDAFPLEYGEIIRAHAELYGTNPFTDKSVSIAPADLRRACETQVKSHLVHLREEFIESKGRPAQVAELVRTAAPAFAALLRNVARLGDVHTRDRQQATREGASMAGLSESLVTSVLALDRSPGATGMDPASLFPEYLAAVEQLAHTVDTWKA